ncbi:AAA family ATPase [Ruegeria denitrificans]|uniref:AAA family ATPase n=1 Tax=Ruegeria denitrificans TaxID=1715692 RepID=UPI00147C84AD
MSRPTWEEDEIFALAGFCHDEADILRPVLSAANSRASWKIVKQMILERASSEDLLKVINKRSEETARFSDEPENWRQTEISRLREIDPTLTVFAQDAVEQMASLKRWKEVMGLISERHTADMRMEASRAEGEKTTAARYLLDRVDFEYLPRTLRIEMPEHIKQLTTWSNQFARLASLDALNELRAVSQRFPHCYFVIEGMAHDIECRWSIGSDILHIQPTLLVGEPGVGKTAFAMAACKALGLYVQSANVGGKSENHLFGLSVGWSSAHAGIVTEAVAAARVLNPMIILDEIDKTHASRNGDITGELLALLESSEARRYREKYLAADVDASHVSWILTANDLSGVPAPLLSRCTIYEIPPPTQEQLPAIIQSLVSEFAAEFGLRPEFFQLDLGDVEALVGTYERHKSVRVLRRLVRGLLHQKTKNYAWN